MAEIRLSELQFCFFGKLNSMTKTKLSCVSLQLFLRVGYVGFAMNRICNDYVPRGVWLLGEYFNNVL